MRGLMICVLATAWAVGVLYAMSRRSRLEASPGHARYIRYIHSADGEPKLVESIDRDFRDLVHREKAKKRHEAEDPNGVRRWFELLNTSFRPGD